MLGEGGGLLAEVGVGVGGNQRGGGKDNHRAGGEDSAAGGVGPGGSIGS